MAASYTNKVGSQFNDVIFIDAFISHAFGFAGDDVYVIGAFFDDGGFVQVKEEANQGKDTVRLTLGGAFPYVLPDQVENLEIDATTISYSGISLYGNAQANVIKANPGVFSFESNYNGSLFMDGGEGNDTLIGANGNGNRPYGYSNRMFGGTGNDSLLGGNQRDRLDGGTGNDTMAGGDGNDYYYVDSTGDLVIESIADVANTDGTEGGFDTVYSSVSYTLAANLELLVLQYGSLAARNGTGNASDNRIGGNDLNNVLLGGAGNDDLYGNGGNDSLDGGLGNDTLRGGTGNNTLRGGEGNDVLYAFGGLLDLLDGGAGNDVFRSYSGAKVTMVGGAGDDFFNVYAANVLQEAAGGGTDTVELKNQGYGYVLAANIENLLLTFGGGNFVSGNASHNLIQGGSGNDRIEGLAGDDVLVGAFGNDTLLGGLGNDTYYVQGADTLEEKANQGTDTVISDVNFTLGINIENLTLTNDAVIGKGNDGNNLLRGSEKPVQLWGFAGNDTLDGGRNFSSPFGDTLFGGAGNDTYFVHNQFDLVSGELAGSGNTFTDTVISSISFTLGLNLENLTLAEGASAATIAIGNAAANKLVGNSANNFLDGRNGSDTMEGGKGDDIYIVGQTGDVVTELLNEGVDTVRVLPSRTTYTLGANLENLEFLVGGVAGVTGTGNTLNNSIKSGIGDDTLDGGIGNDTLESGRGSDSLSGGAGNDSLDGGKGSDTMNGGAGDDIYIVDDLNDEIIEAVGQGKDLVFAQVDGYQLADNVEDLSIVGGAYNGTGNALNNFIFSTYSGVDILNGLAGNDTLDGGGGADSMTGGNGNDTYILSVETDRTIEVAGTGTGTDTVVLNFTSGAYTLEANIENARRGVGFSGKVSGNSLANELVGANLGDELDAGSAGSEKDTLRGGAGNDIYTINFGKVGTAIVTNDTVIENLNEGEDRILIRLDGADTLSGAASFTLVANVEDVLFQGSSYSNAGVNMAITGNGLDNFIGGNNAANKLMGLAGHDSLNGYGGNDTLEGGEGNDSLYGYSGNDALLGGTGDDYLDGGNDNDTLNGGTGNDTYRMDSSDTLATGAEVAAGGIDEIRLYSDATMTVDLNSAKYGGGFVENLTVQEQNYDASFITVLGNKLDNQITFLGSTGTLSRDSASISGGEGNDTLSDNFSFYGFGDQIILDGGSGNDVLNSWHFSNNDQFSGGTGSDVLNVYLSTYSSATPSFSGGSISGIERLNLQYFDTFLPDGSFTFGLNTNSFSDGIFLSDVGNGSDTASIALLDIAANQRIVSDNYVGSLTLDGVATNQAVALHLDGGDIDLLHLTPLDITTLQVTSNAAKTASLDFLDTFSSTLDNIEVRGDVDLKLLQLLSGDGHKVLFQDATGKVGLDSYFSNAAIDVKLDNSNLVLENFTLTEDLNVNVLSASQIDVLRYEGDLNITGGADLVVFGAHDQIDATGFTGNLTLTTGVSSAISITSGSGDDTIEGGANGDLITGGAGADWLTGGSQYASDVFFFNNADYQDGVDVDILTDFLGGDLIVLDKAFFTALDFDGSLIGESTLLNDEIFGGTLDEYEASESTANLIYDFSIGALYYDADGRGLPSNAVQFLQIISGADLSASQIVYNNTLPPP